MAKSEMAQRAILTQLRQRSGNSSGEDIRDAVAILRAGGLVAFPTETVYGLGADATSDAAVARIFEAKQRPALNPLISHVASVKDARLFGQFNAAARDLANAFWPGPLTLVVPASDACTISLLARAGLDTVAIRVPAHPLARALLGAFGGPVAAPSANLSGAVSPTTAAHVLAGLDGRIDFILDGGACQVGVESTIVACLDEEPRILRPGGIPREAIIDVLQRGELLEASAQTDGQSGAGQKIVAPGMLASHYAPRARLRLDAVDSAAGEAALDFAGRLIRYSQLAHSYLDLSAAGDLTAAASNLFAFLRALDASGAAQIAVAPIPDISLGEAINDRLRRAAAGR